jgi:hypothetical protein
VAVVVDEIPMGTPKEHIAPHIKLLMLVNDVSLRALAPREMKTGFGWVQAKPSTSFSPVAVTPDELGDAWVDGRVHLPLQMKRSGEWFGHPNGKEMTFNFFRLIEHAAYSRRLARRHHSRGPERSRMRRAAQAPRASPSGAPSRSWTRANPRRPFCASGKKYASKCSTPRGVRFSAPSINAM